MAELDVRIVRIEPIRVAASYGFGTGPEGIAWEKMLTFIKETGLDKDGQPHRYLGFNNPNPSPGSPNYGYEQWITIGPEVEASGDIKIKEFPGGLYAVTRCRLGDIFNTWQRLAGWRENSPYQFGHHQWLEECVDSPLEKEINEETQFDIYLPIIG